MTIALSGDFIPHMVYKWMKSPANETNLEGYIEWSVTAFSTSDWGDIQTWNLDDTDEKGPSVKRRPRLQNFLDQRSHPPFGPI